MIRLVLVPLSSSISEELLDAIREALESAFPNMLCEPSPPIKLTLEHAYDPRRGQYYSTKILQELSSKISSELALGILDVDLFVPNLNFVFGEAQLLGRTAVISIFRLKPEFYGQRPSTALLIDRARKEAVHEVGHLLGLGHCRNPLCVMHFSNSIFDTDYKQSRPCQACLRKLNL